MNWNNWMQSDSSSGLFLQSRASPMGDMKTDESGAFQSRPLVFSDKGGKILQEMASNFDKQQRISENRR